MSLLSTYAKHRVTTGDGSIGTKGFSLIELLVVMGIIATVSAIALPSYLTWSANLKYRDTAIGLSSKLKLARATAVTKNLETRLELDVVNKQFRIAEGNSSSGSTVWTGTSPWVPLYAEVEWHTGTTCNGTANLNIRFNPNGSSDGGTVCIEDTALVEKYKIVVTAASGRVRID